MTWMPGGHNDWFSVDPHGVNFQLRFNRRATTLYKDFDDAADVAAQLLYKEWGSRPIYLALSGGIDSELTARILLKNKIPFTPVILKIADWNKLESWYAEYWCYTNNIKPLILNYTTEEFFKQVLRLFPKSTQIKNFHQTPIFLIYEHVHQLGGCCVYSGGDINFDKDRQEFYCASLDFISNIVDAGDHPTSFFMYTPELALSYVNQFDLSHDEQYNKLSFYQVSPRPKIEYLVSLSATEGFQNILNRFCYIFKIEEFKEYFWYGTKEQIIRALSP